MNFELFISGFLISIIVFLISSSFTRFFSPGNGHKKKALRKIA